MKFKIILTSCIAIVISFMASSTQAESRYQLQRVYPETPKVFITKLSAVEKDGKISVNGTLKKRSHSTPPLQGHVDIAVYSPEGILLTETTSSFSPSLNLRSRQLKRGSRFTALLALTPPPGSIIRVAFHQKIFTPNPNPTHKLNIAR